MSSHTRLTLPILLCGLMTAIADQAPAQHGALDGEWPTYAGDVGGTKYSGLDQIDASNFSNLEIAWRWQSADADLDLDLDTLREIHPGLSILNFRATPLMVDGVVYVVTPMRQAAALDAGTCAVRWSYDPDVIRGSKPSINSSNYSSRGLAYWASDGDGTDARLLYGTSDGYLLSVDAHTGEPVASFGDNGRVDLAAEIPRNGRGTTDNQGHPGAAPCPN